VDRSSAVQFVIAGDGPLRGYLEALIKELKLEDHCRILGFRSDVEEFLDALDIFVSPSLWEGLPITLIQALMLGKPVVATSVGVAPEVIPQRHAGTLVPPADDKALACAIVRALENRDEVVASLEQSYQLARRLFDPHTQALALDGIFETFAS
jgi:glycosyltransferase involved in cell wall biosynthesis